MSTCRWLAAGLAVAAVVGCGPTTSTIRGTVTFNGEIIAGTRKDDYGNETRIAEELMPPAWGRGSQNTISLTAGSNTRDFAVEGPDPRKKNEARRGGGLRAVCPVTAAGSLPAHGPAGYCLGMSSLPARLADATDADAIDLLRAVGREFHGRSWSLGTSSNYSVVVGRDPLELLVTVSGKDKSGLTRDDFVRVDAGGRVVDGSGRRSSAETLLHCTLAGMIPSVGAVLHTHSVWGTILSAADLPHGSVRIAGYEMLKGLEGIGTHDTFEDVPIFANTQDMVDLSVRLRRHFAGIDWNAAGRPPCHGFLLSGHGLYTWGRDLAEARRHVEIFEFLFECVARARMLPAGDRNAASDGRRQAQQQHQQ